MANSVDYKQHFEDFIDVTDAERKRAEKRRDYRDLKQWSDEEASGLEERGQAPIVFDQFSKKVDGLTGLEVQRRSDPKAYPVMPKYEKAAEAITDALRYVESKTFFDDISSDVFEDKIVEGYGGCIIEIEKKGEDIAIEITQIPWDRIYFDPYSRRKDFKDAKYMGITLWMDIDEAKSMFPKKEKELGILMDTNQYDDTTFEDRPSDWINIKRKRLRINQEYYNDGKQWMEVFYIADTVLSEKPSPYLDCNQEPTNPIELASDYLDRDNNRWGYTQRLIDVQDEINHRRSKALFMLSSKTVIAEKGAFADMSKEEVLNELRKGMTFVEKTPGTEVIVDSQQELGQSQLGFYQDAQNAMDSVGINPELTGSTENAISGRAFIARQQGGMVELARVFARHSEWKTRVYRQVWDRIKQFWNEEKWVRVTDDENAMRFVGLNVPVTAAEQMMEQQANMSIEDIRAKAGQDVVEEFTQKIIAQSPEMGQVVETRNNVVEMDMDIIVEEAPDSTIMRQEQFEILAQLAGQRADPQMFEALIKLSSLPRKEEVMEMFKPDDEQQQAQAQQQQQVSEMQQAQFMADLENKQADTQKKQADAAEVMSNIPLNEAKTKDEIASAMERVGKISAIGIE